MEEVTLINEARILRDNHLYLLEEELEKNKPKSGKNFSKPSAASTDSKGPALSAEQALNAFQSGAWKK